jgi:hypothetical protein
LGLRAEATWELELAGEVVEGGGYDLRGFGAPGRGARCWGMDLIGGDSWGEDRF